MTAQPAHAEPIYHVCARAAWEAAQAQGLYHGSADDRRDGFLHFSSATQIEESCAKHRAGQAGLVLLTVDPTPLGAALKWEVSRGGALFPHLYGALAVSAVLAVHDLPLSADGRHVFPRLG